MKKSIYLTIICFALVLQNKLFAQGFSINTTGATPATTAILDVASTSKGLLIPRMTAAQASVITSPATGLLIYITDYPKGFYYFTGLDWVKFITTDETGSVPINRTNAPADPSAILHIQPSGGINKGLLIPRLSAVEINAIANPATGLLVYNTDAQTGFYYYNGVDWAKFLTKDQNGNVPINNSNAVADPSAILHIQPDAGLPKGLLIPRLTAAQTSAIAAPAIGLMVYVTDSPEGFYHYSPGGWARFLSEDGSGNVGIGCVMPQYKLHVIGDIASSATVRGLNVFAVGAITACSDGRYKKNIEPMKNALSHIMQMEGVTYNWKTNEFPAKHFSNTLQIGFIAQDMEKIIPQVVITDTDGYKGIDYAKLVPVLVEAIKEQQNLINTQQIKNIGLQTQIEELKTEMTLVRAALGYKKFCL